MWRMMARLSSVVRDSRNGSGAIFPSLEIVGIQAHDGTVAWTTTFEHTARSMDGRVVIVYSVTTYDTPFVDSRPNFDFQLFRVGFFVGKIVVVVVVFAEFDRL